MEKLSRFFSGEILREIRLTKSTAPFYSAALMKSNQNELARLRAKRGLTLQDVASGAGVATSTILQIERGRDVRLSTMLAVSRFYGVKPAALWPILK